jgi:hypothetical protein
MTDAPTGTPPPTGAGEGDDRSSSEGGGPALTSPAAAIAAVAGDWPKKAADAVDLAVDTIHDKAIRPAFLVARGIVFGLLGVVLVVAVVVWLSVGLVRLLDVYVVGGRVWISYAILGGIFTVIGLAAWSQRTAAPPAREGR